MAHVDLSTLPRTKKEAEALGSKLYYTGRPCPEGHLAARYTSGRCCASCVNPSHGRGNYAFRCVHCGASAESRKKGTKYCSDQCRWAARHVKSSLARAAQRAVVQCCICGTSFQPDAQGQRPTCGSPNCWKENDKRKSRASSSAYYYRNPKKCRESTKTWFDSNPEKGSIYQHQRRSRMAGNRSGTILEREIRRLRENPCLACGAMGPNTIEHLIPVVRGGSHTIGNLASLCGPCNSSKGSRTWMEWRKQKGARLAA